MTVKNKKNKKKLLTKEEQYWDQVEARSKKIITNLIEVNLPVNITSENFDLEQDTDYRVLLRGDIPEYYSDYKKMPEVEAVAEQVALWYLRNMMKKMINHLADYNCYEASFFENLTSSQ